MLFGCFFNSHFVFVSGKHISFLNACAFGFAVIIATARKLGRVGIVYWIFPSIILLIGLLAVIKPSAIASAPLFIIGWTMLIYGVVECINAFKIANNKRKWTKAEEISSSTPSSSNDVSYIE